MDKIALKIVKEYIEAHLDKSDDKPQFEVYTVWKVKVLQNWKYLISSTLYDGMYYEITYNGDYNEWYLDAYKKFENKVIREDTADTPQTDVPDINIGKIDSNSEKPNNCEDEPQTCDTCKYGEDKHRYAHVCNECGVGINNYEPKTEPQTCSVNGRPYSECADCEYFKCTADEPQYRSK